MSGIRKYEEKEMMETKTMENIMCSFFLLFLQKHTFVFILKIINSQTP